MTTNEVQAVLVNYWDGGLQLCSTLGSHVMTCYSVIGGFTFVGQFSESGNPPFGAEFLLSFEFG